MRALVPWLVFGLSAAAGAEALVSAESARAAAPDASRAAAFARALSQEGDFYRAIGEYKRALFLDPEAPENVAWSLAIGEAYRAGEQPEAAAKAFEAVAAAHPEVKGPALLGAAQSYLAAGQGESATSRAREAAGALTDPGQVRTARYVEGWALLRTNRDEEAARAFALARGDGAVGQGAGRLLRVLPQLEQLPSRSPTVAAVLGLVPGLGHLYIGEVGTAASALAWNGLFGWALYDAVREKRWSFAVVLGMFESMWYGGSIVGAMGGAHRFNRDARVNALEDLEKVSSPKLPDELVQRRE